MTCCSGGVGTTADELGVGADEEGAEDAPAAPAAVLDGTGALTEPAKP